MPSAPRTSVRLALGVQRGQKQEKGGKGGPEAELVKVRGAEDPAGVTALLPGERSRSCPGKVSGVGWPDHQSLT